MAKVYRVWNIYGTEYLNTARETNAYKPGGEESEIVECFDAAGECNRLNRLVDETESRLERVRYMLGELLMECDPEMVARTEPGRAARKYIVDNPLSPATAADRDGQRSYGV